VDENERLFAAEVRHRRRQTTVPSDHGSSARPFESSEPDREEVELTDLLARGKTSKRLELAVRVIEPYERFNILAAEGTG
jgi:hypothetical protein